jgi:hypothetical protein
VFPTKHDTAHAFPTRSWSSRWAEHGSSKALKRRFTNLIGDRLSISGRGGQLSDDVIDTELGLITEGFVTTDCVPNDNTLPSTFPYVGDPNHH